MVDRGEPGIGKSRLLEEAARGAADRDVHVLWGRCWEAGGAPAYWPFILHDTSMPDAIVEIALALGDRDLLERVYATSSAIAGDLISSGVFGLTCDAPVERRLGRAAWAWAGSSKPTNTTRPRCAPCTRSARACTWCGARSNTPSCSLRSAGTSAPRSEGRKPSAARRRSESCCPRA